MIEEYKLLRDSLLAYRLLIENAVRNGRLKAKDGIKFDHHRGKILEIVRKCITDLHPDQGDLFDGSGDLPRVYEARTFKAGDRVKLTSEGLRNCKLTTQGMVREQHEGFIIDHFTVWGEDNYNVEGSAEILSHMVCLDWVQKA